jgi:hypothetical protein
MYVSGGTKGESRHVFAVPVLQEQQAACYQTYRGSPGALPVLLRGLCSSLPKATSKLSGSLTNRDATRRLTRARPHPLHLSIRTSGQLDQQRIPQVRDGCSRVPIVRRGGQVAPRAGAGTGHTCPNGKSPVVDH